MVKARPEVEGFIISAQRIEKGLGALRARHHVRIAMRDIGGKPDLVRPSNRHLHGIQHLNAQAGGNLAVVDQRVSEVVGHNSGITAHSIRIERHHPQLG